MMVIPAYDDLSEKDWLLSLIGRRPGLPFTFFGSIAVFHATTALDHVSLSLAPPRRPPRTPVVGGSGQRPFILSTATAWTVV
jgi:hypothetical protein